MCKAGVQVYHDPWKVLLVCMLLNRTNANQVRTLTANTHLHIHRARRLLHPVHPVHAF
jgi:hypothetical protein